MIDLEEFYQLVLQTEKHGGEEGLHFRALGEEGCWTQVETLCSCQLSPQQPEKVPKLRIRDTCKQRRPGRYPATLLPPNYATPTVGIQEGG